MTPEDAAKHVIRMLSAYPESAAGCSTEYLATLAETLCQFPLEVAVGAASPVHGVPKKNKDFKPTAGQVADWCEAAAGTLEMELKWARQPPPSSTPETSREVPDTLRSFAFFIEKLPTERAAALCHLWMRAPDGAPRVAMFSDQARAEARKMPLTQVCKMFPQAIGRFDKPISECPPYPPEAA